ncbi:low molecular weight protein-tyrosine-phosphatase [Vibrio viridaestus]|uniref:protein-tyrosine-phosphatase n=1 Tax=Vibrio viridaestus TaxID=2487322 RepID=A0A3N9TI50_9VIBR|nr:low molecular weight protein-tyrosine-phosphatase [Vibrio viridaestus]RQW63891.1 low molecular weight phosphotyrosine protein phosphatase [Vibrio viridaestus]
MFNSILVLCSGNICRSPYAEEMLRTYLSGKVINSAGLIVERSGLSGKPPDESAVKVALQKKINLSNHRARQVTESMIRNSDLILVMGNDHIEMINQQYPFAREKTMLLGQWIGIGDIEDPYQKDLVDFISCFNIIDSAVFSWVRKLT